MGCHNSYIQFNLIGSVEIRSLHYVHSLAQLVLRMTPSLAKHCPLWACSIRAAEAQMYGLIVF